MPSLVDPCPTCGPDSGNAECSSIASLTAVATWNTRYQQRAWVRQLSGPIERYHEDRVLEVIERFDGRPFPTTLKLLTGWLRSRTRRHASVESVFCAELVATTYQHMGLLPSTRPANWYDPGRFWSGDHLPLVAPYELSAEIAVR